MSGLLQVTQPEAAIPPSAMTKAQKEQDGVPAAQMFATDTNGREFVPRDIVNSPVSTEATIPPNADRTYQLLHDDSQSQDFLRAFDRPSLYTMWMSQGDPESRVAGMAMLRQQNADAHN